jgi:hypothetical protein
MAARITNINKKESTKDLAKKIQGMTEEEQNSLMDRLMTQGF